MIMATTALCIVPEYLCFDGIATADWMQLIDELVQINRQKKTANRRFSRPCSGSLALHDEF
ncbi:hypothetical protein [Pseudomonas sp. zfem002]|uniref:hypothetical protein n=1 Tax=Pseudomonas sp. zfem002 TaxID=3078197 RepID=UPI00292A135E|nr:hypothetical protein [Pseudomonas sp. zfem002]MDU9393242.1 hypothetical protein [Pseudomonas sp. zfem002]